jgi:hypothetical protein
MSFEEELKKRFQQIGEETEKVDPKNIKRRGGRKGVNYRLPYPNNCRKRKRNDKKKGLHQKRFKYPVELNNRLKALVEENPQWLQDLGIKSINDFFIIAAEKLLKENE